MIWPLVVDGQKMLEQREAMAAHSGHLQKQDWSCKMMTHGGHSLCLDLYKTTTKTMKTTMRSSNKEGFQIVATVECILGFL